MVKLLFTPIVKVVWCRFVVESNAAAFAYVELESAALAKQAVDQLSGRTVLGVPLILSTCSDVIERRVHKSPEVNPNGMLFIEGLHISCSVEGLKQLFAPFGTVLWSRLIADTNGHSFCFGYAQMSTHAESLAAIAGLNGTTVRGKMVRVVSSKHSREEIRGDL